MITGSRLQTGEWWGKSKEAAIGVGVIWMEGCRGKRRTYVETSANIACVNHLERLLFLVTERQKETVLDYLSKTVFI